MKRFQKGMIMAVLLAALTGGAGCSESEFNIGMKMANQVTGLLDRVMGSLNIRQILSGNSISLFPIR